jgi:hypothetical protein
VAYFLRKLNKKRKLPIYLPLTDLGLIIQQNKTKPAFIGLWPIRGLFSKKIDRKKIPFYRFGAHFSTKENKKSFFIGLRPI